MEIARDDEEDAWKSYGRYVIRNTWMDGVIIRLNT